MLLLNTANEPSIGILVPLILGLFLGLLLAIDYGKSKITERFRSWLIIGLVPFAAVFLIFESKAQLRLLDFLEVYPPIKMNPGFRDILANYIILTFTGLILTRALSSKRPGVLVFALLELGIVLLALALEVIHLVAAH